MNARIQPLQRRAAACACALVLVMVAMLVSYYVGWRDAFRFVDPAAVAALGATIRVTMLLGRAREQEARDADERAKEAERRRAVRRLSAADAGEGQCPVCAYDDLDRLAERDRFLEVADRPAFRRVAPYGNRRAHQECAELVPYKPTASELAIASHERNHHGHPGNYVHACPLCTKETLECIAADPDIDQPVWPPLGVTAAEASESLLRAFAVAPHDLGNLWDTDYRSLTHRSLTRGLITQDECRLLLPPGL
jgi:hypothetical protein